MKTRRRLTERQRLDRQREQGRDRARSYRARQSNPKYAIPVVIKGKGKAEADPIRIYGPPLKDSTILKVAARMKIQQPDRKFGRAWIQFMSKVIARAVEDLVSESR